MNIGNIYYRINIFRSPKKKNALSTTQLKLMNINEYWKYILQDKHMKASSVQVSKYFPHRKLRRTKVLFFIILRGILHEGANKNVLSTT